jgi:leucyl-tRNA synthetase
MSSDPSQPTGQPAPGSTDYPPDAPDPNRYDHAEVEPRWQRFWEEHGTFRAERSPDPKREKRYLLDMFPYPSGAGLHVGHPEGYTATDIVARFCRMRGIDVLHPMGWDAFGLPAEQHAIKTGTHPAATTRENVANFMRQLKMLGFSYDWAREVNTTDPGYVRWTQWIFLKLFERGLAYQDTVRVNWCAGLGTVLANEEVVDGKSDIGGFPVERLPLRQWMLRITAYADRLADDLSTVDWPQGTVTAQRRWIGRSEGAEIRFTVSGFDGAVIEVFTTRPDTLMGATYVVLAPEHPLVPRISSRAAAEAVSAYVATATRKSDLDRTADAKQKTGVDTGAFAVHPISGERLPIWVADYVLGGYGTGAVMAVPAHDERDFAFAQAHRLPMVEVVSPDGQPHAPLSAAYVDDGVNIQSGEFDGLKTPETKKAIVAKLAELGAGAPKVTYRLRDWVFSRQRYWGEPIPIYFPVDIEAGKNPQRGDACTIRYDQPMPVPEGELPLRLPDLTDFKPGEDPAGPLARAVDWRFFQRDGKWFARETNTMPQWAGSCWYYLRFLDPHNEQEAWSQQAYDAWMPVDLYVGGGEHAVLHLLYARFWHKVLFDIGKVSHPEPFTKLVHQGMILGEDNEKMSKSRGNVINPDDIVKAYGADVLRLYEMAMGPLEAVKPWQSSQIQGQVRFRSRLWTACRRRTATGIDEETKRLLHRTIKKVTRDIEAMSFHTAIAAMNIFVNHLTALPDPLPAEAVRAIVLLVAPFAPHIGEELWKQLGNAQSLAREPWPIWDEALCVDDQIEMAVQVNGKVRGRVVLARTASEAQAREAALAAEGIGPHTAGKQVKKFIYVPARIINIVVG